MTRSTKTITEKSTLKVKRQKSLRDRLVWKCDHERYFVPLHKYKRVAHSFRAEQDGISRDPSFNNNAMNIESIPLFIWCKVHPGFPYQSLGFCAHLISSNMTIHTCCEVLFPPSPRFDDAFAANRICRCHVAKSQRILHR